MKKQNFIYFAVVIFVFLSFTSSYSQFDNIGQECGTSNAGSLTNIPVKTPGSSDFLRCLVIYITFPDDIDSGYSYTIWQRPQPPISINTKPINPYSGTSGRLIDSLVGNPSDPFMTRYSNYTMSDFFCEMSMG